MPRGGRRPGAGAPKGNFNAVTTGNNSPRLLMVYLAVLRHPDWKALAYEIYEGGFFPPPTYKFNEDIRGVVDYLWRRWFDSPQAEQSKAIKAAPKIRRPRPSTRQRQLQRRAEQLRLIRRAKKLLDLK